MADLLPINFEILGEQALINVDWTDFASGQAYVTFYGSSIDNSGTVEYYLSNNVNASYTQKTLDSATHVDETNGVSFDLDFDTSNFNLPKIINGDVIVSVPVTAYSTGTANGDSARVEAYLYKVNGVTETLLGSETGKNEVVASNSTTTGIYSVLRFNVSNKVIAIGEKLRLNIKLFVTEGGTGGFEGINIYHSPGNLSIPTQLLTSQLKANIPFRVEN